MYSNMFCWHFDTIIYRWPVIKTARHVHFYCLPAKDRIAERYKKSTIRPYSVNEKLCALPARYNAIYNIPLVAVAPHEVVNKVLQKV